VDNPLTGRRVASLGEVERPGDYYGPSRFDGRSHVWFLKPNARDPGAPARAREVQHVSSPPHRFRECADGSLEIRNSIGSLAGGDPATDDGWHGYLNEGHQWVLA
jgi:hypothetical protein